ncbi:hypothetical protein [Mycoplasma mycoides]|uniref:Lipoprotein n=1 Tax=Mycoplasma mycoides subsp. capri TaxID=40477 RepID=A0AB38GE44_MYCMC|nr:hypothetical protein [Mycoplasma mycoides]ADH21869.1 putative liporotein [synthetic Mycoplasma mycoides JCVI-syn1.0]ACU78556.1 putative liporotein [Mycoplasma mycoides subsp. capri str. GM12]ACU79387.1 putative liporotein [Mycoplasma mycoides subsp. capri str. GM12]SRX58788.1 hypothetical protein MMC68K_00391 [Mycoplasma mycoides subsp. capri]SRX61492.1 hypothetical protein MMC68I_00390 [Mycoplasma mycoides subsp. capri]
MKKSLFALSFLTILSSSVLVVSCRNNKVYSNSEHIKDNSESKNKHNNQNNTDSKNDITIKNPINKEDQPKHIDENSNKNPETKKEENDQIDNSRNQQNDQPTEKEPNSDGLEKEKERVTSLLKDLSKTSEIKYLGEELIFTKQDLYSQKIKNEEWRKYKQRILKLFEEKKFNDVKEELLKLLKELLDIVQNKRPFEEKQKTYKDITINESLKDSILVELRFLFETKFSINQKKEADEVINKFNEEIEKLINNKNVKELEKKLIDLIKENKKLEIELKDISN